MATYILHLKSLVTPGNLWGEGTMYVVGTSLKEFFNEVLKHKAAKSSGLTNADYSWSSSAGTIKDGEMLIYFVNSQKDSLIKKLSTEVLHSKTGSTAHGLPGGTLSEVYVDGIKKDPDLTKALAAVAFHEAMHNKLFPLDIHANGGGGLASPTIMSGFGLTEKNKKLMAENISKSVNQLLNFL